MAEKRPRSSVEEENQTAKMSPASLSSRSQAPEAIIQDGPLFDPVNFTSLIQIVNELDPASFVKFARTCKDLHHFCYKAKGIQVQFYCSISRFGLYISLKKFDTGFFERGISEQGLEKLRNMPFNIVVKSIYLVKEPPFRRTPASLFLEQVRQMLLRFTRVAVESVDISHTDDWNGLILFLQEFNVKRVEFRWEYRQIPVAHLPFFLTNLDYFDYERYVSDELILSATVKELYLEDSEISKYTFMDLIQKFANEDIVYWMIARNEHEDEDVESDPFIEACSEIMKVVKIEEIDGKNMEPSVLYNRPSDPRKFFMRKSDGSIGKLHIFGDCVTFDARI